MHSYSFDEQILTSLVKFLVPYFRQVTGLYKVINLNSSRSDFSLSRLPQDDMNTHQCEISATSFHWIRDRRVGSASIMLMIMKATKILRSIINRAIEKLFGIYINVNVHHYCRVSSLVVARGNFCWSLLALIH